MKTDYIYERDFYCIDNFASEEKWFEYLGYTYLEEECKYVEYHIIARLSTVLNHEDGIRGWIKRHTNNTSKVYIDDFENYKQARDFIDHFFYDDESGEEKSLDDIDMNTPCGNYWSRF